MVVEEGILKQDCFWIVRVCTFEESDVDSRRDMERTGFALLASKIEFSDNLALKKFESLLWLLNFVDGLV